MQFKIPFTNKNIEIKSNSITSLFDLISRRSGNNILSSSWHQLSIHESLTFYQQISPLYTAVDLIANEFCSLKPKIWDTEKSKFIDEHPAFELLKNPNPFQTQNEFMKTLAIDYLVTGNAFLAQTGPIEKEPLEINTVNPLNVNLERSSDGAKGQIRVQTIQGQIFYERLLIATISLELSQRLGAFRFVTADRNREILHIQNYNPSNDMRSGDFFGLSPLTAIFYEIQQFIESSIHNWSLLKRGAKPTGGLEIEDELTEDERERLQAELNNMYSGSENTGRPMLLERAKWVEMGMSNRDMDFMNLKNSLTQSIYNLYKIPLPLVSPEQMTLSNMETAKLSLYDNAVIPLCKFIYSEMTQFILRRYPKSETLVFTIDETQIPALIPRIVNSVEKLSATGTLTPNELRTMLGREAAENGDDIMLPANLLPLISDRFTSDNLTSPRPKTPRKQFIELVDQIVKDSNGEDYKEVDILEIAKKNGL